MRRLLQEILQELLGSYDSLFVRQGGAGWSAPFRVSLLARVQEGGWVAGVKGDGSAQALRHTSRGGLARVQGVFRGGVGGYGTTYYCPLLARVQACPLDYSRQIL